MDVKINGQKFEEKYDFNLTLKITQDNYEFQKGK